MTRREGRFVYLNTGTYVLGTETYVLMLGILAVRKAEKSLPHGTYILVGKDTSQPWLVWLGWSVLYTKRWLVRLSLPLSGKKKFTEESDTAVICDQQEKSKAGKWVSGRGLFAD